MQLWEQGLVDLDAPANDYLRAYRLIPAKAKLPACDSATLLTHTAGIREVVHPSGMLQAARPGRDREGGTAGAVPRRVLPGRPRI